MNRKKLVLKRVLIAGVIAELVLCLGMFVWVVVKNPDRVPAVSLKANSLTSAATTNSSLPVKLMVPSIGVDAPIELLGVTTGGDMEAPGKPQDVGWYKLGPHPGDIGSAVIAGHYGPWPNGEGSVFDSIKQLKQGDVLYVLDNKGRTSSFVIKRTQTYDKEADTAEVFKSADGKAHLNLITCTGAWNQAQKSYSDRLVVFADKQ